MIFLFNPVLARTQPADLAQKQEEAKRVKAQLQKIDDALDVAVEEYNQADLKLARTQDNLKKNKEDHTLITHQLGRQRILLNQRIVNIYKNPDVNLISILVGTKNFTHFLTRLSYLVEISNQDFELLQKVQATQRKLEETEQRLKREEQTQTALVAEIGKRKKNIEAQIGGRQTYLAGVQSDIQTLVAQQEEQDAQNRQQLAAQQPRNTQQNQPQPTRNNNQNTNQNPPVL